MELKDTVHLPKTAFPMRAALAEREPVQLQSWEDSGLYQATLDRNAGKTRYVLHDGPPYANGAIHLGHCLNKVLKDIIAKHAAMNGLLSDYVPGWDCHGLPIELQVDKKLGPKKRELTAGQFRKACRAYAEEQLEQQRREFKRLGIFGRWDDPYTTMAFAYEAQTVRELAHFARRGALYRRKRPVNWCMKDQTALAEAEVEHEEKKSPSIYVAFELVNGDAIFKALPQLAGKKVRPAIWTTTPWTIPANLAIAANPEIHYAAYDLGERGVVLVAKELLVRFLTDCAPGELTEGDSPSLKTPSNVLGSLTGKQLTGVTYKHPLIDRVSPILMAEHATIEAGTGMVHTAPGHGEDDYRLGLANGLPIFAPVDKAGRFEAEAGIPELTGVKVFEANPRIVELLHQAGALLNAGGTAIEITHSYPHCWRCHQPVIFRATDQWWIGLDLEIELKPGKRGTIRKAALEAIDTLAESGGFVPAWGKERIRGMVENRPDWCISRQRQWGVPIPVAYCASCREPHVAAETMDHVAGFFEKEGADAWFDRELSELLPAGTTCAKCGGTAFTKETDILDVWFDSGSSFAAVLQSGKWPLLSAPADLYLEGSDQHRGWFNSSLTIGIGAHGEAPYKGVLTHGFVVDGAGRKMSKSLGNTLAPEGLIKKYGAEVVRLWVAASDYRDDIRLSNNILDTLSDGYRKIRNTLRYCLSQLFDYDPAKDAPPASSLLEIDRWALSRLERYRGAAEAAYRAFEFHRLYHATVDFCAVDLSAFYFDVLKDRTYCSGKNWTERRAAQYVLHRIADTLCRVLAPVASFTAEEAWAQLPAIAPDGTQRASSVFLAGMPASQLPEIDESLEEEFRILRLLRERVNGRLEEKRTTKELGKATEAEVILALSHEAAAGPEGEVARKYSAQLADLFLCAYVQLETIPESGREQGVSFDAMVKRSEHPSCARCYRALADVTTQGQIEGAPGLCARCVRAVQG
jgi:isoleucyl-tRNA synthetase